MPVFSGVHREPNDHLRIGASYEAEEISPCRLVEALLVLAWRRAGLAPKGIRQEVVATAAKANDRVAGRLARPYRGSLPSELSTERCGGGQVAPEEATICTRIDVPAHVSFACS